MTRDRNSHLIAAVLKLRHVRIESSASMRRKGKYGYFEVIEHLHCGDNVTGLIRRIQKCRMCAQRVPHSECAKTCYKIQRRFAIFIYIETLCEQ